MAVVGRRLSFDFAFALCSGVGFRLRVLRNRRSYWARLELRPLTMMRCWSICRMCVMELGCVIVSAFGEDIGKRRSVKERIPLRPPESKIDGLSARKSTAKVSSGSSLPGAEVTNLVSNDPCLSVARTPALVPKAKRRLLCGGAGVDEKMHTSEPRETPGPRTTCRRSR